MGYSPRLIWEETEGNVVQGIGQIASWMSDSIKFGENVERDVDVTCSPNPRFRCTVDPSSGG